MRFSIAFLLVLFAAVAYGAAPPQAPPVDVGCPCAGSCACPKDKCPGSCPVAKARDCTTCVQCDCFSNIPNGTCGRCEGVKLDLPPIPPPAPPAYTKVCDANGCRIVPATSSTVSAPSFAGIAAAGQFMAYRESNRASRPGLFRGLLKRIRNR